MEEAHGDYDIAAAVVCKPYAAEVYRKRLEMVVHHPRRNARVAISLHHAH